LHKIVGKVNTGIDTDCAAKISRQSATVSHQSRYWKHFIPEKPLCTDPKQHLWPKNHPTAGAPSEQQFASLRRLNPARYNH
jgi:hypothetical protein